VIRLAPPITEAQIDSFLTALPAVLDEARDGRHDYPRHFLRDDHAGRTGRGARRWRPS
jgi:hypothetical protein